MMVGHGSKFSRKKEEAIAALLSQRNTEDAARAVGIGLATLLRWMRLSEFQIAYREARRDAVSQATARLQQATGAASSTVLKIMLDSNAPAAVRLRAAESVLNHAAKSIEVEDIEVRLSRLERTVGK